MQDRALTCIIGFCPDQISSCISIHITNQDFIRGPPGGSPVKHGGEVKNISLIIPLGFGKMNAVSGGSRNALFVPDQIITSISIEVGNTPSVGCPGRCYNRMIIPFLVGFSKIVDAVGSVSVGKTSVCTISGSDRIPHQIISIFTVNITYIKKITCSPSATLSGKHGHLFKGPVAVR